MYYGIMIQKLKPCKVCGKPVKKPSYLSRARYEARAYCSRNCYFNYMRKNKEGWWKNRLDFRNRKLTPNDRDVIKALEEFGYIKKEDVLLPQNID